MNAKGGQGSDEVYQFLVHDAELEESVAESVEQTFSEQAIDTLKDVKLLSKDDLKDLGLSMGIRNRIIKALQAVESRPEPVAAAAAAPAAAAPAPAAASKRGRGAAAARAAAAVQNTSPPTGSRGKRGAATRTAAAAPTRAGRGRAGKNAAPALHAGEDDDDEEAATAAAAEAAAAEESAPAAPDAVQTGSKRKTAPSGSDSTPGRSGGASTSATQQPSSRKQRKREKAPPPDPQEMRQLRDQLAVLGKRINVFNKSHSIRQKVFGLAVLNKGSQGHVSMVLSGGREVKNRDTLVKYLEALQNYDLMSDDARLGLCQQVAQQLDSQESGTAGGTAGRANGGGGSSVAADDSASNSPRQNNSNTGASTPRNKRNTYSLDEKIVLDSFFWHNQKPNTAMRQDMVAKYNEYFGDAGNKITLQQLQVYYSNRRRRLTQEEAKHLQQFSPNSTKPVPTPHEILHSDFTQHGADMMRGIGRGPHTPQPSSLASHAQNLAQGLGSRGKKHSYNTASGSGAAAPGTPTTGGQQQQTGSRTSARSAGAAANGLAAPTSGRTTRSGASPTRGREAAAAL
eukprot:Clim_evm1s232 gene=Clim_evmTU1s232